MDDNDKEYNWELWSNLAVVAAVTVGAASYYNHTHSVRKPTKTLDLINRRFVITGASSGIGAATARQIYNRGGSVVLAVRDVKKGELVKQSLRCLPTSSHEGNDDRIQLRTLDLSSLSSIYAFASSLYHDDLPIHALINNAGTFEPRFLEDRVLLPEVNIENTIMTNYVGPFYLTHLLKPLLIRGGIGATQGGEGVAKTDTARVVNVGSKLERNACFPDPSRLTERDIRGVPLNTIRNMYAHSKHLQLLASNHEAHLSDEEEKGKGRSTACASLISHTVSPGMCDTLISRTLLPPGSLIRAITYPLRALLLNSPETGAGPVVWAATNKKAGEENGKYYDVVPEIGGVAQGGEVGYKEVVNRSSVDKEIAAKVYDLTLQVLKEETQKSGLPMEIRK